jgi:hypothetical protein
MFGSKTKHTPVNPVRVVKDATGAPAVDLDAVKAAGHVELAKSAGTVGVSLRKRGLSGMRGRVIVVLDHSGSMAGDYRTGVVQELLLRTLAFGLQISPGASVEVIPFDNRLWSTVKVDVGNYTSAVRSIWQPDRMGSTDLARALNHVRQLAASTSEAIVCVVLTDGNPDDRAATSKVVCDLARYPVFLKFLALRSVPYLTELDDLEQTQPGARLLDNVDSKTIADPAGISDTAFAEAMTDEWDSWLIAAQAAGVLVS